MPVAGFATLTVEIAFASIAGDAGYLVLDDTTAGLLDTATLGPAEALVEDVTANVERAWVNRGTQRFDGVYARAEAGRAGVTLDNSDREFDPTNLAGPHVAGGSTEIEPMRMFRLRATWAGVGYDLWRGFADQWALDYNMPQVATTELTGTDGTKVISNYDSVAGSLVGGGETTGARINRILDNAGWPGADRDIDTGRTTVQSTDLSSNAWSEILLTSDTEIGETYFDAANRLVFRNRHAVITEARSITPQGVFGEGAGGDAAAPVWVSATTNSATGASNIVLTVPAGTADGDLLLAWVQINAGGGTITPPAGWTLIRNDNGGGGTGINLSCYWRIAASEPANYTFTRSASGGISGSMSRITGAHPTAPIDMSAGQYNASGVDATSPGVTTTTNNTLLVFGCTAGGAALAGITEPAGTTERWETLADTSRNHEGATAAFPTAGATGTRTATLSAARENAAQLVAVAPAPATAGGLPYDAITISNDDTQVRNIVRISRVGGTLQTAEDADSIARYQRKTWGRSDLIMETDVEASNYADYVLSLSKDGELRFDSIRIDPTADPDNLWPQVLGRELGDRITIIFCPPGGGDLIERDVFIRGIRHDITMQTWITTWPLQDASAQFFSQFLALILDDAGLGKLDTNVLAAAY